MSTVGLDGADGQRPFATLAEHVVQSRELLRVANLHIESEW